MGGVTDDEIWAALLRFHREVFLPDFRRIVEDNLRKAFGNFETGMDAHFEALHRRFDRMEAQYQAFAAGRTEYRHPRSPASRQT